MDENKLRKIALHLIDTCQKNTDKLANREDFIYAMAFNDGVLGFMNVLLKEQAERSDKE